MQPSSQRVWVGIGYAVLATLIWSGNFIIARDAITSIPPITLAFYRWLIATVILLPLAWKGLKSSIDIVKDNKTYFLITAATGVTMFNTFVYIAGHYSSAINMALLGTTTSPIISVILASILLNEKITRLRVLGMIICISGVLVLLSNGTWERLFNLQFTKGDLWILAAALSFAVYNTMVKKRPITMHSIHFLFSCFAIGTFLLLPFYLFELNYRGGFDLTLKNLLFILYLGLGTSVIAFLCWNAAIHRLGAGRTALFGNLIPVFSSIEAVLLLNESITLIHFLSFVLVILGLVVVNIKAGRKVKVEVKV